jgi:hypothetical protein
MDLKEGKDQSSFLLTWEAESRDHFPLVVVVSRDAPRVFVVLYRYILFLWWDIDILLLSKRKDLCRYLSVRDDETVTNEPAIRPWKQIYENCQHMQFPES